MSNADAVAQAEQLHREKKYKEVFDFLRPVAEGPGAEDVEILFRYCRAHYDLAQIIKENTDEKKAMMNKALEIVKKMLAISPDHWAPHKWHAIILSGLGDFESQKDKIANAYIIRDEIKRALELAPGDSNSLHMMGRWCFSVAGIGWMARAAASALFGTPPTSTYEEALDYFLQAQTADPNNLRNAVYLGDTYLLLKQKDNAKTWFQKAVALPYGGEVEQDMHNEAQTKLSKI
eukprot:TRINITY_DN1440_c0_g1_i2.p1 TRINITY_DN1440_c0_g1~~TRINITY_DN1440_c0_g1_i2.p1  ORF type:complete len:233 (-),score=79.89 TRINITY_DN1440_c0_g1_i2:47-745(-)